MTADEEDILVVLDQLAAAFNAHDIDAIMAHFADDCSLDLPRGPEPHGTRYVGREVRRGLLTRFETTPDVHCEEVENFACGSMGISRWLLTGTALKWQWPVQANFAGAVQTAGICGQWTASLSP